MSTNERTDIRTRFKKGRSGNPSGRPKGRKNKEVQIRDILLKEVLVKDGQTVRSIPKIAVATEVCVNKAMKGNLPAWLAVMKLAERYDLLKPVEPEITHIVETIIDPALDPPQAGNESTMEAGK